MPKPKIQIGEEVRTMTDAEYAQYLQDQADEQARQEAAAAKALEKAAILAKLNLTEEELKTVLA